MSETLDIAVAEAMGWARHRDGIHGQARFFTGDDSVPQPVDCPEFSADDYSGFAAVEKWLTENRPTPEQGRQIGCDEWRLEFYCLFGEWTAGYVSGWDDDRRTFAGLRCPDAPTLPEAACRLLVAWAKLRAERGWA